MKQKKIKCPFDGRKLYLAKNEAVYEIAEMVGYGDVYAAREMDDGSLQGCRHVWMSMDSPTSDIASEMKKAAKLLASNGDLFLTTFTNGRPEPAKEGDGGGS